MVVALMDNKLSAHMVSMISSFYGCSNFFLCLIGVKESVYGLLISSFFVALYGFQILFRLCSSVSVGVFVVV